MFPPGAQAPLASPKYISGRSVIVVGRPLKSAGALKPKRAPNAEMRVTRPRAAGGGCTRTCERSRGNGACATVPGETPEIDCFASGARASVRLVFSVGRGAPVHGHTHTTSVCGRRYGRPRSAEKYISNIKTTRRVPRPFTTTRPYPVVFRPSPQPRGRPKRDGGRWCGALKVRR